MNRVGTSRFGLERLINLNNAAEGSGLLPKQVGEFRVPFASQFTLERTEFNVQTFFTLSWLNVDLTNVANYRIYVNDAVNTFASPIGPFVAPQSPVRIAIPGDAGQRLVFTIQTVLNNGFQSSLDGAPTVTGITLS